MPSKCCILERFADMTIADLVDVAAVDRALVIAADSVTCSTDLLVIEEMQALACKLYGHALAQRCDVRELNCFFEINLAAEARRKMTFVVNKVSMIDALGGISDD